jgi:ATP-dependent helicase HrpB
MPLPLLIQGPVSRPLPPPSGSVRSGTDPLILRGTLGTTCGPLPTEGLLQEWSMFPNGTLKDLPIVPLLERISVGLKDHNVVLIAPPGAGKTTLVPLALLDAPWRRDDRILLLEPRRLAARAAAARMAALLGEGVGQTVGYRTRLDVAVSAATRIEVVTEGLLVRRLLSDPGLEGVAVVLLDEVHERSLESDLAQALCRDLQRVLRPELRLVAMSATPDATRLAALLDAAVIESPSRLFPVAVTYAAREVASPRELPEAMARAVRNALHEHSGDVLAFLPGMAEIRRVQLALASCGALVLPLHGELPPTEQDHALRPAEQRRVVLATSIAETSLTVPGVRVVIDGGWRRAPRLDPGMGLTRLATMRISRAAADQRAGRAGREMPGAAIRLWSQALHRGLPAFDRPEILESELSALLLTCAAWGTPPSDLPFLDMPPVGALAAAAELLAELGALDESGTITGLGRRMAGLGVHPRLAAMLLAAESGPEAALAASLAALLEERDPLRNADTGADVATRLMAIMAGDPRANQGALGRIRQVATQHRRRLHLPTSEAPRGDPGRLLAAGFPDRIAQRRGEPGSFRLSGGGGARLARTDPLARANLLAVAALEIRDSPRICLAAPLDPDALPHALASRVTESVEVGFDPVSGAVLARRRRRLGALVLSDHTVPADPTDVARMLARGVAADGLRALPWTDEARQFQARIALMGRIEPDGAWPDLADDTLMRGVETWLAPCLQGYGRLTDLARINLAAVLRELLPRGLGRRLDEELPERLALRGGHASVDYTQDPPLVSGRAQLFYGLRDTPVLARGRVRPVIALLSPAGRPIAMTRDLTDFWRGGWAAARRDMRGRYPKHDWPEDPAVFQPSLGNRRAGAV